MIILISEDMTAVIGLKTQYNYPNLVELQKAPLTYFIGIVERMNKSELRNPLTYRGLIYIFKVGRKTFRLSCQFSRPKSQISLILRTKERPHFFSEVGG